MDNLKLIDSNVQNSDILTPSFGTSNQISVINNCDIINSNFLLVGDIKDSKIKNVPKGSKISNSSNCKLDINYDETIKWYNSEMLDINLINCLPGSELIIMGNPIILGTITVVGKVIIKDFAIVKGDVRLENCTIGGYSEIIDSHIPFDVTKLELVNSNLLLDTPQFIGDKYTMIEDKSSGLFRIKAIKNFGNVHKEDIGGLVTGFYNLSQDGDCWIEKGATVEHKSKVIGNTVLPSNCYLKGKVTLEDCKIQGELRLCGDITLSGCTVESKQATINGRMHIDNSTIKAKGDSWVNSSYRVLSDVNFISIDDKGFSVESKEDWYSHIGTE